MKHRPTFTGTTPTRARARRVHRKPTRVQTAGAVATLLGWLR